MKTAVKLTALFLVVSLGAFALFACGGNKAEQQINEAPGSLTDSVDGTTEPSGAVGGTTGEWGGYTFLIPDGFALKEAGEFSSYDFALVKSDFSYFYFNTEADDEMMMAKYDQNKNTYTNGQTDFKARFGENEWTGFQYSDGFGGYGFEAYTTIDGHICRVSSAGFQFNSAESAAVLSSFAAK